MKRILLALALLLLPSVALAQCNGVFPNNTVCGNATGSSNTPRVTSPSAFQGSAGGTNGQIQYNNSGALGGFTMSGSCTTNTTTGAISCTNFPLNALFGGGVPWVDVESGANGCAIAIGNNSNDDQPAIQCQVDYMYHTYSGGVVYFHPFKSYGVASPVTVKGGVVLQGAGKQLSLISALSDITTVAFDSTAIYAGLRDIFIVGSQSLSATGTAVTVSTNTPVNFSDCQIWGGKIALNNAGTDGAMYNCYVQTLATGGTGISSSGANWYTRVKIDTAVAAAAAYAQTSSPQNPTENHFTDSDFSGNYTNSVTINGTQAITVFTSSVFSSPITITTARATIFTGGEIGTNVVANGSGALIITGSYGFSSITASGTATRSCAGNFNITC